MNKRQRLEVVTQLGALLLALYLLETHRLGIVGGLLVGSLGIIIGRSMHIDGRVFNLFGEDRDYSLKPAGAALIKAAVCAVVAILWAVSIGLAIRHGLVADNVWTAYGLLGVPLIRLFSLFALFLKDDFLGSVRQKTITPNRRRKP
jgi:hypothetical protein